MVTHSKVGTEMKGNLGGQPHPATRMGPGRGWRKLGGKLPLLLSYHFLCSGRCLVAALGLLVIDGAGGWEGKLDTAAGSTGKLGPADTCVCVSQHLTTRLSERHGRCLTSTSSSFGQLSLDLH